MKVEFDLEHTLSLDMECPSQQFLDRREQRRYRRLAGVGHVSLFVYPNRIDNLLVLPHGHR
jgi:hypothetical protein